MAKRVRTRAQDKVSRIIKTAISRKKGAIKAPELKNSILIRHWDDLYSDVEVARMLIGTGLDAEIRPILNEYKTGLSVSTVFGISPQRPATAMEIENILDLRRADGSRPVSDDGRNIDIKVVRGARALFLSALGMHQEAEPTEEEIAYLKEGLMADGTDVDIEDYETKASATYDIDDLAANGNRQENVQYSLWPEDEREFAELLRGHDVRVYIPSRGAHVPLYDREQVTEDEVEEAAKYLIKQASGLTTRAQVMLTLAEFRRKRSAGAAA